MGRNIETIGRAMAIETIENAFNDYKISLPRKLPQKVKDAKTAATVAEIISNYDRAKHWFSDKSQSAFGYYWCLEYGFVNPNEVKKYLPKLDILNVNPIRKAQLFIKLYRKRSGK